MTCLLLQKKHVDIVVAEKCFARKGPSDVDRNHFIQYLISKGAEPACRDSVEGYALIDSDFDDSDECVWDCVFECADWRQLCEAVSRWARTRIRWRRRKQQHDSGDAGFKLLDQCRGNELLGERGEVRHGVYGLGWQPAWSIGLRI